MSSTRANKQAGSIQQIYGVNMNSDILKIHRSVNHLFIAHVVSLLLIFSFAAYIMVFPVSILIPFDKDIKVKIEESSSIGELKKTALSLNNRLEFSKKATGAFEKALFICLFILVVVHMINLYSLWRIKQSEILHKGDESIRIRGK